MSKQSKLSEYEQKYQEIELIGKGTQGTAMLVECKADKKRYVSKKVFLSNLSEKDQNNAIQELKLLREMKHPNIVKFIESYKEKNKIIIIMEYCECGDLSKLVKEKATKGEQIEENLILQWFIQICSALQLIHSKKVIHRDIKSSNIFLTKTNCVKIGDFGISKQLDNSMDKANTLVGTPYYLSPEVCQNKPYTYKTDMWSLGCVLYELCALKHPFQSNSLMSLVMKIASEKTPKIPQNYSLMIDGFIRSLLNKQSEKRPSSQDILNNQHIKKLMKEFVLSKENIVNDIQNMKQMMISKGASQGEITLMEKQFQERIQKQQESIKAQIQSQVIQNESTNRQTKRPSNSIVNQSHVNPSTIQNISRGSMNLTQKEKEIQEQLSYLQSEVKKSYQRLNTPQNSAKKESNQSQFQDSGVTVRSEMMQTSSNKKKQPYEENNYSDGENTIQSIAISKFESSNKKSTMKSQTGISYSSKKNQLGSTVKSFIAEDDNENVQSSGMTLSNQQQKESNMILSESQQTVTNSQVLTSSEGERESQDENEDNDDEDDQSEKYSPSMALDLIQNESILLSKFVFDKEQTLDNKSKTLNKPKQSVPIKNNESGIQEYSTENEIIYGSRANKLTANDNFSETSVSLNVSLTQDSVFLKTKLGFIGLNSKQNNLVNQIGQNQQVSQNLLTSQFENTNNFTMKEESCVSSINKFNKQNKINSDKQKNEEKIQSKVDSSSSEYYEDDFEEYEDDFEEYQEDVDEYENNDKPRASQKFDCHFLYESDEEKYEDDYDQLDSILDLYKDQLNKNQSQMSESVYKFDLTEIIEESVEQSALYSEKQSQLYDL